MGPGSHRCESCGVVLHIGDWPYCPHGPVRELNARAFEGIVVWESDSDPDKLSFPGQAGERVPEGYHAIEITNLHEADALVRRVNRIERVKSELDRSLNYQALDERIKLRRAEFDAKTRGNLSPQAEALLRASREWADKRREQKRSRHSTEPNFHIQVLSFDSGNRNSYSGPETGWREKKK